MKRAILIILLSLIFSNVVCAQKAPDGFCDLRWMSTRQDLKKLINPIIDHRKPIKFPDISANVKFDEWRKQVEEYHKAIDDRRRDDLIPEGELDFNMQCLSFYSRGKWEKLGEASVTRYWFNFTEKDQFYMGWIDFPKFLPGQPNFDILLKALTIKYRKPNSITPLVLKINPNAEVGRAYTWVLENKVEISLRYNDMEERGINGTLTYVYLPIWHEINRVRDRDAVSTKDKL
jgi:hypothetical protein